MNEIERNYPHINILKVKYEAFCADPIVQLREIAEFCELSWDTGFENHLKQQYVGSENSKWQSELTQEQQAILHDVLAERLVEQGYELGEKAAEDASIHSAEAGLEAVRRS
jgi:glutathione peroxidase-family protein